MSLRNLVHCVLALTLGFAGLAALYLQLGAQFVGFTQILVYVGAVAILAVFVIMMTKSAGRMARPTVFSFWITGSVIAGSVFAVLAWAIGSSRALLQMSPSQPEVSVQQIGDALMHRFVLPLEIMGLLLTAALIGAVVLAMQEKRGVQ
ncbi:MAG: NADH-quinone oxidoreductase subunit J family protein [Acidobacteriaceae bacterium]